MERVTVLHAGALTDLVGNGLAPALRRTHGLDVTAVAGHSVALASRILDGSLDGDVYLSADANTNALLTGEVGHDLVRWFLVFARNSIVLAYSKSGPWAAAFDRVKRGELPWYEVMRRPGIRLARNDPNLDPLGYYTLLVCTLAEQFYGIPGLKRQVIGDDVNPEQVGRMSLAGLVDGSIDAIFLYRSAAIGKPFGLVELPDAINLGNSTFATSYARAHFRTRDGHEFRGTPISFSATVLATTPNLDAATRFVAFLTSPAGQDLVQAFHFIATPILLGGSVDALPLELAGRVKGTYLGQAP